MTRTALPAGTQITLMFSSVTGIVAIASGTRYRQAHDLLDSAGFDRREDGTGVLTTADTDTARLALTALTRLAADRQITLNAGTRPWLGDTAQKIAALLPGAWQTRTEVYCLPVWQQDLAAWLWDDGDLISAVRNQRIPYGVVLADGSGTELLMVDKPNNVGELLIGAFARAELDGPFADDSAAPNSITTSTQPGPTAEAITSRLLPAYRQAVYHRRVKEVAVRLDHALSAESARSLVRSTWPPDDGTGIGTSILARVQLAHQEALWDDFRSFLLHGPHLLDHLKGIAPQPGTPTGHGEDEEAVLARLHEALRHGQSAAGQWAVAVERLREADSSATGPTYAEAVAARTASAQPALRAWLKHGPVLVTLARRHPPADTAPHATQAPASRPALPPGAPVSPPGKRRGTTS
ncbi:hypothetical protein [Streptomyces sp. HPF1205]|uniref:hypothetical protein n=1 Tax=Streptomyces sp. HPF1205 TaxID=2873262 RepID=UPI001CED19D3|nr:hypothetical protein [Streptomyces sp. HPF1205]